MERTPPPGGPAAVADWSRSDSYAVLLGCDRRAFAWEWMRRSPAYRRAWAQGVGDPGEFGLVSFADPALAVAEARPMWASAIDPSVLDSIVAGHAATPGDGFDIRDLARFVSVDIGEDDNTEHWLLSNGRWVIRLAVHDGTLLGGPLLLEHHLRGMAAAEPKLHALRRLVALSRHGRLPAGLRPKETRAPRWIMELQTADAMAAGANQQDIARALFGHAIAGSRWRIENGSYRLRVQRLVRAARRNLRAPLSGPWFA
ncbi:MAG: DUF2285 domain-containing protein [Sphingopyxis sp.]|nr:DUF2285 domain-containing protein [Sphingopyxis sp.]